MRIILVPTDFSECSKIAEEAALKLARRLKATLYFYHNYYPALGLLSLYQESQQTYQDKLDQLALRWSSEFTDVSIQTNFSIGKLTHNIESVINRLNVDLVVMGSHGISGKSEYFIGSNAQKIVRTVHVPVLTLKRPITDLTFKKVIFASNFNASDKQPFRRFLSFIRPFDPKLFLVNVDTPTLFDTPIIVHRAAMEDFAEIAHPMASEIRMVNHFSVDSGVRLFAKEIQADLVAISNHHRHPLKRMTVGSNVEALVNHVEIPVLTIDYKK